MPHKQSIGSINAPPCLLVAYFELCGAVLPVIVDTGATISCLPEHGLLMTRKQIVAKPANLNAIMADNFVVNMTKKVSIPVRPKNDTDRAKLVNFYICNGQEKLLGYEAIIGLDSLKLFELQIIFDGNRAKLFHHDLCIGSEHPVSQNYTASIKVDDRFDRLGVDSSLSPILKRYKSVFTNIGPEPIRGRPMRFITVHSRPIFAKMRNYNRDEIIEMKERVSALLREGVIEPTRSGYAATSRIVPKRSGPGRLVVNYIPLNAVTLRDSYCLPRVSDIINAIAGMKYFSTMDCAQGFYQILVDPRDRHKTAFSTPLGNFQYVRCPFGARNSCAVFQAEMNRIFADGLYTRCAIYVDDILVFGRTRREHDDNLSWVLERAKEYNVKIKLEKCNFAKTEVDYLGFRISGQSIRPLESKVQTLCKNKPPRDRTELRSLIGRLNFYSRFIPQYSRKLEPLRELFRTNKEFEWQERHQRVFETLIECLSGAPPQVLSSHTTMKYIELHIFPDSLEVLCLSDEDELICRASRFLLEAESNYSVTEKQLLALVLAINKFRCWLQPEKFVVRVPTKDLEKVFKLVNRPERVDNLMLRLPEGFDSFSFDVRESLMTTISKQLTYHLPQEIYYIDGACKRNGKPDCLASWAVCAEYDASLEARGLVEESPSNNSAELTAAIRACEIAKDKNQTEITIVTDSRYLHSAVTQWIEKWTSNDWQDHKRKQVINTDLFKRLIEAKKDLKIEWLHVKGHANTPGNIRADLLARSVIDEDAAAICSVSIGNKDIQGDDAEVTNLKKLISEGRAPGFVVEDDCLYRIDPKMGSGDPRQIYVPKSSVRYLLRLAHDNQMYGGHLGIKKTFGKLYKFWWPGKHKDVETYVRTCEVCQMFKRQHGLPYGYLHSIPVSTVFENLHLDMIGPVTSTINGNKYIITATDAFSKWAFASPCKNITTQEVINFIEKSIIAIHGQPKNIITDRGVQFRSKQWKDFIRKRNINHNMTSGYHPQANGIDERFNGTLVRILLAYIDEEQENWDEQVKWAVYLYNTTIHNSTGFTPYHVLFGFSPRTPLNAHSNSDPIDLSESEELRSRIREITHENIQLAQEKQTAEYNKRHSKISLQIGDLIWAREHACPSELSKKLMPKYYGPCVIVEILGELDNPKALKIFDPVMLRRRVISMQDFKPYEERPDYIKGPKQPVTKEKGEAQDKSLADNLLGPEFYVDSGNAATTQRADNLIKSVSNQVSSDYCSMQDNKVSLIDLSDDFGDEEVCTSAPVTSSPKRVTINNDIEVNFYDCESELEQVEAISQQQTSGKTTEHSEFVRLSPPRLREHARTKHIDKDDSVKDPTYVPSRITPVPKRSVATRTTDVNRISAETRNTSMAPRYELRPRKKPPDEISRP